ncbi:probable serine/threonine-protein kinase PIX13 isoform X2 [Populus nigra]|uniref:probable serine/threonine-protein kinase PIX13 isoform X2 n=1 Tax=Populus nigra TaxID=3691 RepID=UPI002B268DF3|nr:probable serine/threonine-protein kinase PIX13 isoform X2 [Populus nigra]
MLLLDPFFCLSRNQRNQFIISYPRPAGRPQHSSNPETISKISIRMGNCWGTTPVTNHNSPTPTKPSTPETTWNHSKENGLGSRSSSQCKAKEDDKFGMGMEKKGKDEIAMISAAASGQIILAPKLFTLAELKSATRNFKPNTVLGEGGFGRVFKGWVDEKTYAPAKVGTGMAVAVKKSSPESSQGLEEWQSEVEFLGKLSHPNLVKLLGYCWEDEHFLLVYEYMQKGSLEKHLFRKGAEPLAWDIRLKIAIGAAQGLAFLHTSDKSVIYRDFKTSNILLDGAYNAKLSDFGLAKLGPLNGDSHVTTRIMGTYGYAAPEYLATGHLYVKSDVYGFGVVLLELLTGLKALDTNRPSGQHNLVEYARPFLLERRKLKKIMDPGLEERYPLKAAMQAAELILRCLESDLRIRPSMEEVSEILIKIKDVKEKPKKSKSSCSDGSYARRQEERSRHQSPLQPRHGGTGYKLGKQRTQ